MNYNIDNNVQEYKECAGKDCKNVGINNLKIKYIHKSGWFCNSCKQALEKDNLLETDLAIDVKGSR